MQPGRPWPPVIVGIDGSEQSIRAATFGVLLAEHTDAACRFVHAVPEYWTSVPPALGMDVAALDRAAVEHARNLMRRSLADLPPDYATRLENDVGRAPLVLSAAAQRHGAGVVILGGKRHTGMGRLAGSTINQLVRLGSVPVLAHTGEARPVTRVLAATDLSAAAGGTIAAARAWAAPFGATVRVLHVVEPVPVVPGVSLGVPDEEIFRSSREHAEGSLQPHLSADTELIVRRGRSAAGIVAEARDWEADLIVVSSHGKDWMQRLMIGSTSERLLHVLPAPILVLPPAMDGPASGR